MAKLVRRADPISGLPRRLGWILTFLGFFLVIGAWAVAMPYDGSPDEKEHVLRAVGVAQGEVIAKPAKDAAPGGGAFQTVPKSLLRDNCFRHHPDIPASCGVDPGGDETLVRAGTAAGRYHPGYYAIVGWPLALAPNWTGLLLARLLSAALCAALLANALTDALRWSRFGLLAAGVLVVATPMAAQIGGAVNPNGVEISAGIAFFAAAIPLLYAPGGVRSRTLLWHAGIAALALASLRTAGPLWLGVSVVALVVPLEWRRLRQLWQRHATRWWVTGVGLAAIACVCWTIALKTNFAGGITVPQNSLGRSIRLVIERWDNYTSEMIIVGGWLDTFMPPPVYLIWEFAAGALIIWGFLLADRGARWRMTAIGVGGVLLPSLIQIQGMNTYGMIMQGRYLLPLLAGLPLLAAFTIQRYGLAEDKSRSLIRMFAVLLLPLHLICLDFTLGRWQQGVHPGRGLGIFNPWPGTWHPPLGPIVPLVASLLGLVLIGWRVWSPKDGGVALESGTDGGDALAKPVPPARSSAEVQGADGDVPAEGAPVGAAAGSRNGPGREEEPSGAPATRPTVATPSGDLVNR